MIRILECGSCSSGNRFFYFQTPVVEDNVGEVADALVEATSYKNVTSDDGMAVAKTLENIVDVASPSPEVSTILQGFSKTNLYFVTANN